MRPIAAPDEPVGALFQQGLDQGNDLRIRRLLARDAIAAGQLDPAAAGAIEAQKSLECGLVDSAFGGANQADVVDDIVGGQLGDAALQLDEIGRTQQELDVPAHGLDALGKALEISERQAADMRQDETHAARSGIVQPLQFLVGCAERNDHDHAGRQAELARGLDHASIVFAIDTGLD